MQDAIGAVQVFRAARTKTGEEDPSENRRDSETPPAFFAARRNYPRVRHNEQKATV